MENRNKKKIIVLTMMVIAILVIVLGTSYAFFRFSLASSNQELVAGQIYMHYKDGNRQVNIEEGLPSASYDENQYFEFTIDGKNTSSKDIWYAITLLYGEVPNDRNIRIKDNFLKFTLFENDNKVIDGIGYDELNNKKLWVNKIAKNTTEDVTITYKLYMWISDTIKIGTEGDYSVSEWNNQVYASVKVNVVGDFTSKVADKGTKYGKGTETVKDRIGQNDGLIGITEDNESTIDKKTPNIREYRYSGPTVNNYVTFNDETWRILGVFKDEAGQELIKIVRNERLLTMGWRELKAVGNWEEASLNIYLNETYLPTINQKFQAMIANTKYYLGTLTFYGNGEIGFGIDETPIKAYYNERAITGCVENKGPSENTGTYITFDNTPNCRVWADNPATWTGKIALMYPSDFAFTANNSYWKTTRLQDYSIAKDTSWLQKEANHISYEWFLSPISSYNGSISSWTTSGYADFQNGEYLLGVRPSLYLKTEIKIVDGDGSINNQYKLAI